MFHLRNQLRSTNPNFTTQLDFSDPDLSQDAIRLFPRALGQTAMATRYGLLRGYARVGWADPCSRPSALISKYENKIARHLAQPHSVDRDSGLSNMAHIAWDALAALELTMGFRHVISIEGNIGAGKSTLLAEFATRYGSTCRYTGSSHLMSEPVTEDMLQGIYNRPEDVTPEQAHIKFRNQLLDNYVDRYAEAPTLVLNDRCPYSTRFFDLANNVAPVSRQILARSFCEPSLVFYVRTPPEVCLARVAERGRDSEEAMPIYYLEKLHEIHDNEIPRMYGADKVVVLDGTRPTAEIADIAFTKMRQQFPLKCVVDSLWD